MEFTTLIQKLIYRNVSYTYLYIYVTYVVGACAGAGGAWAGAGAGAAWAGGSTAAASLSARQQYCSAIYCLGMQRVKLSELPSYIYCILIAIRKLISLSQLSSTSFN